MFDESNGMLDAETWQIVYSFFHPEETWCGGDGSLLAGIASYLSGPVGVAGGASLPGAAVPRFYSGRPACLVWAADENEDEKNFWRAQIMVTSGLGIEETVVVSVTDSQGENIGFAKLILLNSNLEVKDGAAEYCLAEFQRNLTNTTVALVYPDGRRVPGSLNLDCDLF